MGNSILRVNSIPLISILSTRSENFIADFRYSLFTMSLKSTERKEEDDLYDKIIVYSTLGFVCLVASTVVFTLIRILPIFIYEPGKLSLQDHLNFASAASTVILTGITFYYAMQTRRMAENAEKRQNKEQRRREKERIENWYGSTIAVVRQMQEVLEVEFQYENSAVIPSSRIRERDFYREFNSLSKELRELIGRRPTEVEKEISYSANSLLRTWTNIKAGEQDLAEDASLNNDLRELEIQLSDSSEWYGDEERPESGQEKDAEPEVEQTR